MTDAEMVAEAKATRTEVSSLRLEVVRVRDRLDGMAERIASSETRLDLGSDVDERLRKVESLAERLDTVTERLGTVVDSTSVDVRSLVLSRSRMLGIAAGGVAVGALVAWIVDLVL